MPARLTPELLILLIVDESGGHLRGKTLLQKRAYFLGEHFQCSLGFDAHYYGPYSPLVDAVLGRLKSLGLIQERSDGFGRQDKVGFEWRRYEFAVTDDGRKVLAFHKQKDAEALEQGRQYLRKLRHAGDNGDYTNLSIAAKTFFILKRERKAMNRGEIQSVASRLGWDIASGQIKNAEQFLERLGLIS